MVPECITYNYTVLSNEPKFCLLALLFKASMKGNQIICLELVCAREGKGSLVYFRCFTVPKEVIINND